jgi:AcrR family transcriptional regulator
MSSDLAPTAPPLREPKQSRSRASFEKVLAAARTLLVQRSYENFTLADVVSLSGVSLGSIYARVDGKDDLIRVVQARVLEEMNVEEAELFSIERWEGVPLASMLPGLVYGFAEYLRSNAPMLMAFMHRAPTDELIRRAGQASGERGAKRFEDVLLLRRDEIKHPDPERAAHATYITCYSCFARYLGLGTSPEAAGEGDWELLKEDVLLTCASFLQFALVARVADPPHFPAKRRRPAPAKAGS